MIVSGLDGGHDGGDVDGRGDQLRGEGEAANQQHQVILQQALLFPTQSLHGRHENAQHLQQGVEPNLEEGCGESRSPFGPASGLTPSGVWMDVLK